MELVNRKEANWSLGIFFILEASKSILMVSFELGSQYCSARKFSFTQYSVSMVNNGGYSFMLLYLILLSL